MELKTSENCRGFESRPTQPHSSGFSTTERFFALMREFIQLLLLIGMKNLKHWEIKYIGLLYGTLETAIEILKFVAADLETLHILQNIILYDISPDRRKFVLEKDDEKTTLFDNIKEYVVNGREDLDLQYPCLLFGETHEPFFEVLRRGP